MSGFLREVGVEAMIDLVDSTVFNSTSKTYVPGNKDGKFSFSGLFDNSSATLGSDVAFNTGIAGAQTPISTAWDGWTQGNRAALALAKEASYSIPASRDDLVKVEAEFQADGGVEFGAVIHSPVTADTATGDDAASADFGATSTTSVGFAANIHVTAFTGTNCTVKLIDSANNSTFADVTGGGFTAATGVTSQQITHASTSVRRYVKTNRAGTFTSINYAVTLAKRA
jgi:hypothetical protein